MKTCADECAVTNQPNQNVVEALNGLRVQHEPICYVELGVYEGATALHVMEHAPAGSHIHLFDYKDVLEKFAETIPDELRNRHRTVLWANSDKTLDSYCWGLGDLLSFIRAAEGPDDKVPPGVKNFKRVDLAFIDGAHTWHHDGFAVLLLEKMMEPGGTLVLDDVDWTFGSSPTVNPEVRPETDELLPRFQQQMPQVRRIVHTLLENSPYWDNDGANEMWRFDGPGAVEWVG